MGYIRVDGAEPSKNLETCMSLRISSILSWLAFVAAMPLPNFLEACFLGGGTGPPGWDAMVVGECEGVKLAEDEEWRGSRANLQAT